MGSDASQAALKRYGAKRLGVITPYMPVGDAQVRRFFDRLRLRDRAAEGAASARARC